MLFSPVSYGLNHATKLWDPKITGRIVFLKKTLYFLRVNFLNKFFVFPDGLGMIF